MQCGAGDQRELAGLGNGRAFAEHGVILTFDGVEDFLAASAEELDINGNFAADFADQRQSSVEPFSGALDFEAHHLTELWRVAFGGEVTLRDLKAGQVFEWKVDSSLLVIDADILPEIRQLQGGAGEVGELLAFGVAVPAEIKHEMSDWIGGIVAVTEQVVEGLITGSGLVLAECGQQIGERLFGNLELAHGFG